MIGATIGCLLRGKIVKAEAKTVGIMPPPMNPCSARQKIIDLIDDAFAQQKLINVNPAAEATKR